MHKFLGFFLVSSVVFTVFAGMFAYLHATTGAYSVTQDYFFHKKLAEGTCYTEHYAKEACERYPIATAFLSGFFIGNETIWLAFFLSIGIIIIPFLIWEKTNSYLSLGIYYSSYLLFNIFYAGLFAQLVLSVLFALLLRNDRLVLKDFFYVALGFFVHSTFVYVLLPVLAWKYLKDTPPLVPLFAFTALQESRLDLDVVILIFPAVFWLYLTKLEWHKQLLILYFILASAFIDYRAILFTPILLAFWMPEKLKKNTYFTTLLLALNFLLWFLLSLYIMYSGLQDSNTYGLF